MRDFAAEIKPLHGLEQCACGCGRTFKKTKNRNGTEKRYYSGKCRTMQDIRARLLGREIFKLNIPEAEVKSILSIAKKSGTGKIKIIDQNAVETRRQRQQYIDFTSMPHQERLGLLCRAAEKYGVIK